MPTVDATHSGNLVVHLRAEQHEQPPKEKKMTLTITNDVPDKGEVDAIFLDVDGRIIRRQIFGWTEKDGHVQPLVRDGRFLVAAEKWNGDATLYLDFRKHTDGEVDYSTALNIERADELAYRMKLWIEEQAKRGKTEEEVEALLETHWSKQEAHNFVDFSSAFKV